MGVKGQNWNCLTQDCCVLLWVTYDFQCQNNKWTILVLSDRPNDYRCINFILPLKHLLIFCIKLFFKKKIELGKYKIIFQVFTLYTKNKIKYMKHWKGQGTSQTFQHFQKHTQSIPPPSPKRVKCWFISK